MSTTATKVPPHDYEGEPKEQEEEMTSLEGILKTVVDGAWHYLPQLAIIAIAIPILLVVSAVAGLIVRNSVPRPWQQRVFLHYGEDTIPSAHFPLPTLVADQAYDISVHLTVPYTETNAVLGNFMTYLTITTASNKTIASASRPSLVPPAPSRGLIRRLLPFPSRRPHTVITIPILPEWTPKTSSPLYALLEVGRRDGWRSLGKGEGREITVLDAHIQGAVLLHGTRRVVGRYPNATGLASSGIFFITSALGLVICFYRFAAPFETRQMRGGRIAGGGGGPPLPPMPVPKTLPGRPTRRASESSRRFIKREPSVESSASSVGHKIFLILRWLTRFYRQQETCQIFQLPVRDYHNDSILHLLM
ncbi:SubName: Full=Uncharacterized protein {ECO:0000313/EMBL:CCA77826.1} [Serendipita indica DSM 11827]|nr:SubName: Full=Uncharacterized protein {ECO:0000313/EMBL:CCA77826.1} [Serendipita indica DSM 11827]